MSTEKNSTDAQQLQHRVWVKEQEINALKVQNRHLISKLEDAEEKNKPNQINTQQVAVDVQTYIRPVLNEIEKSLAAAFDVVQGTMRGIYQQSQRVQSVFEEMTAHQRDLEIRMTEQRKSDQAYFQEKIFTTITTFCDRVERQIENRLKALGSIETIIAKQNETLSDIDALKSLAVATHTHADANRAEMTRIRSEFKLLRDELQASIDESSLYRVIDTEDEVSEVANTGPVPSATPPAKTPTGSKHGDLTLILDLLHSQKEELKAAVWKSEKFLKKAKIETPEINPQADAGENNTTDQEK